MDTKTSILKQLDHFKPLNYNRFFWWRRWVGNNNNSLPNKSKLINKILNGDFDSSSYLLQVKLCDCEIQDKVEKARDIEEEVEITRLDRLRRKKLWEDYLKDENHKLEQLKKECCKHFSLSPKTYDILIINFDGDIEGFYYFLEKKQKK